LYGRTLIKVKIEHLHWVSRYCTILLWTPNLLIEWKIQVWKTYTFSVLKKMDKLYQISKSYLYVEKKTNFIFLCINKDMTFHNRAIRGQKMWGLLIPNMTCFWHKNYELINYMLYVKWLPTNLLCCHLSVAVVGQSEQVGGSLRPLDLRRCWRRRSRCWVWVRLGSSHSLQKSIVVDSSLVGLLLFKIIIFKNKY